MALKNKRKKQKLGPKEKLRDTRRQCQGDKDNQRKNITDLPV